MVYKFAKQLIFSPNCGFCKFQKCLKSNLDIRKNPYTRLYFTYKSFEKEKYKKKFWLGASLVAFTTLGWLLYLKYTWKDGNLLKSQKSGSDTYDNNLNLRKRFNFVADIVEKCSSAVVSIELQVSSFGLYNIVPRGSGFIIKEDGLILTNAHVVMSQPHSLVVKLKDGRMYYGKIEDIDLSADLATVRINETNLSVMKIGSSEDLRAGEWVIAIGSPCSLSHSVSTGVVSAPQRKGEDLGSSFRNFHYIQTDVTTNYGNSGGPLVNLDGEVVGINTLKVTSGISFAIPVEYIKSFLLEREKRRAGGAASQTDSQKQGYLGVTMVTLTDSLCQEISFHQMPDFVINKVLLCDVPPHTPAHRSGLKAGDIILEANGQEVKGIKSIYEAMEVGKSLLLKIYRDHNFLYFTVNPEWS